MGESEATTGTGVEDQMLAAKMRDSAWVQVKQIGSLTAVRGILAATLRVVGLPLWRKIVLSQRNAATSAVQWLQRAGDGVEYKLA